MFVYDFLRHSLFTSGVKVSGSQQFGMLCC